MKQQSKLILILIPLAVVVFTLIVVEIVLSFFYPIGYMKPHDPPTTSEEWNKLIHRPSAVPGLLYELSPNKEKYDRKTMIRTNSWGMRDSEPLPLGKNSSVCNIVVVGDSFTFGLGVSGEDTYPNVLEKLLSTTIFEKKIQVLNFGVAGYTAIDNAVVLKHKGILWKPKLIIVGYNFNDPEIDPIQPLHQYYQKAHWWQYVNILRFIAKSKKSLDIKRTGKGDYIQYLHAKGQKRWESVIKGFNEIKELSQKQNIPVILVIFPHLKPVKASKKYLYRGLHRQVAKAGKNNGFYVIDLLDKYSIFSFSDLIVSSKNFHPNEFAHVLAAQSIHETINEHFVDIFR